MRLHTHTIESAPEDSKGQLEKSKLQMGFIPNMHGVLAGSPKALEAYKTLTKLFVKGSLSKHERHVVWLTINVENDCHYCIPAHAMLATMDKLPSEYILAIRKREALSDDRLEALRLFTIKMVQNRGQLDNAELEAFINAGYSQENVLDIIVGIAHKTISNYTNHLADTEIDKTFASFI